MPPWKAPETWEISELLAKPTGIKVNPKVINVSTFQFEFVTNRRTRQQLLDLAQDAIEGLEIILEQNRRLASIASRIKGQGAEWESEFAYSGHLRNILGIERELEQRCLFAALFPDSKFDHEWVADRFSELTIRCGDEIGQPILDNAKFINDSGELPAVLNDDDPSFADQRITQPRAPQYAGVPSLMEDYRTSKDDEIKSEALRIGEILEARFREAKQEVIHTLFSFGNKEIEEGPRKVLYAIIADIFDYDNDMRLLRRYVDRLEHLKPRMAEKVLRQRVISEFEAGKFDRFTTKFANRLKYQLSTLERVAEHVRSCSVNPSDSPKPSQEDIQE